MQRSIPCWRSRDAWLLAVSLASHGPRAAEIMARRVSRRALMAVARADAAAADHATGRWVATANATVARITGLCERTVQYARAALVHLGLCRVVATAPRQSVSRPAVMAGRQPHSYRSHAPQPSRRDQGQGRRRTR